MTILLLKTALLLVLLGLGGLGIVIWFVLRLRLNLLLTIGFSLVVGLGVYAAFVTALLLNAHFSASPVVAWGFGVVGLVSLLLALARGRWTLVRLLVPNRSQLGLLLLSLILVAPIAVNAVLYPLTSWDAKMIWVLKAKAIYVQQHVPNTLYESDLFSSAHKDYPLGFPALVAAHYQWFGGVSEQPVALTYVTFFWLLLVLTGGALERVLNPERRLRFAIFGLGAALFLILLAGDPMLFAGLGLADVPLASLFLAATVALLGLATSRITNRQTPWLWFLLGLSPALAALSIKNEGSAFALLYLVVGLSAVWLTRRRVVSVETHERSTPLIWWATAALPVLATLVLPVVLWHGIKVRQGYRVDLLLPGLNRTVQFYLNQVIEVTHWFLSEWPRVDHWGWAILPMTLLVPVVVAWWRTQRRPLVWLAPLGLLGAQLATYGVVYVTSPHDLTWHITTSLDRLMLHLVPTLYLTVTCLIVLLTQTKPVYSPRSGSTV
ncbi:MAG: hypothetical protein U0517_03640 [Candidatus Andersenbacteria bacterium]